MMPVGTIYGFEVVVKTDKCMKDGFEQADNRFYVRMAGGDEDSYLYHYNYGRLAGDPRTAALNPINALGSIEPTLEKLRKKRAELEKDIPQLRQVIDSVWRKEAELAELKIEIARIDRQIQLTLNPVSAEQGQREENAESEQRQMPAAAQNGSPATYIPARLRQIADATAGCIIIGSVPSAGHNADSGKKQKL